MNTPRPQNFIMFTTSSSLLPLCFCRYRCHRNRYLHHHHHHHLHHLHFVLAPVYHLPASRPDLKLEHRTLTIYLSSIVVIGSSAVPFFRFLLLVFIQSSNHVSRITAAIIFFFPSPFFFLATSTTTIAFLRS
ncbi:hypothetical protein GALMADRAFT_786069 [Galerina marginata CBS 339.88]|uniref:Uncharacterized protein n=1 Tax=Galerina marginata (strain CBS 339.88) TaxID=685588 RepID=A0A067SN19_GALM3|nr:hypothetical protein GALMADRAFT_786069 [Galerina marginata CBS 339.88]